MRAFDAAVNAVSEPENTPDKNKRIKITADVIQNSLDVQKSLSVSVSIHGPLSEQELPL
jgi:hypothetical protein